MQSKTTTNYPDPQVQNVPAGLLPGDYSTELFGIKETRKVFALCNGATIPFNNINPVLKAKIFAMMLKDEAAMNDLRGLDHDAAIEEFAFCIYGDVDSSPDFCAKGVPGTTENFTCGDNCRCLKWQSKNIMIDGNRLTARELQVTRKLASDKPDKLIAYELKISHNTLVQHKRNLYDKAGVQSRTGLVEKGFKQRVIQ